MERHAASDGSDGGPAYGDLFPIRLILDWTAAEMLAVLNAVGGEGNGLRGQVAGWVKRAALENAARARPRNPTEGNDA